MITKINWSNQILQKNQESLQNIKSERQNHELQIQNKLNIHK